MEPEVEFIQHEDGSHEIVGATNYNNSKPRKFQSLTTNSTYKVLGYSPTSSSFAKSYILNVKDYGNNEFEIYSTKKLTECIDDTNFSKSGGFRFNVNYDYNLKCKHPDIIGYKPKFEENKPKRQFTML